MRAFWPSPDSELHVGIIYSVTSLFVTELFITRFVKFRTSLAMSNHRLLIGRRMYLHLARALTFAPQPESGDSPFGPLIHAHACTRKHTSQVKPGHEPQTSASASARREPFLECRRFGQGFSSLDRLLQLYAEIQATGRVALLPRILTRHSWPTRTRVRAEGNACDQTLLTWTPYCAGRCDELPAMALKGRPCGRRDKASVTQGGVRHTVAGAARCSSEADAVLVETERA